MRRRGMNSHLLLIDHDHGLTTMVHMFALCVAGCVSELDGIIVSQFPLRYHTWATRKVRVCSYHYRRADDDSCPERA